jgi:hypothetical protein
LAYSPPLCVVTFTTSIRMFVVIGVCWLLEAEKQTDIKRERRKTALASSNQGTEIEDYTAELAANVIGFVVDVLRVDLCKARRIRALHFERHPNVFAHSKSSWACCSFLMAFSLLLVMDGGSTSSLRAIL